MIVVVGSTNEAKVFAVKEVIQESSFFPNAQVLSFSAISNVSEQPLTLEETMRGAKNRARDAFSKCKCNWSFGIESGLMETSHATTGFLCISICSIFDGKNDFIGLSTGFELPPRILKLILDQKMDMNQACLHVGISQDVNLGSKEGLIGILTKGKVGRKEYSKQCIETAVLQLENSEWYQYPA